MPFHIRNTTHVIVCAMSAMHFYVYTSMALVDMASPCQDDTRVVASREVTHHDMGRRKMTSCKIAQHDIHVLGHII